MKSKIIIGIPLTIIALTIIYNYFDSPPVGFKNIRGHYIAENGPIEGCVLLLQPGAGINVFGHIGGKEKDVPDFTGKVTGVTFTFNFTVDGASKALSLDASSPVLVGNAEYSAWKWTKTENEC